MSDEIIVEVTEDQEPIDVGIEDASEGIDLEINPVESNVIVEVNEGTEGLTHVSTDETLSGDGTEANPLSVVGSAGGNGDVFNVGSLLKLRQDMMYANSGIVRNPSILTVGDSFGGKLARFISYYLGETIGIQRWGGFGGGVPTLFGDVSGWTAATIVPPQGPYLYEAGDAVVVSGEFDVWLDGAYFDLGPGGSLTARTGANGPYFADRFAFFYHQTPGGGTFDLEYATSSAGPWTVHATIDTDGTLAGKVAEIDLGVKSNLLWRAVGVSGQSKVIRAGYVLDNEPSFSGGSIARGGLQLSQMVLTSQAAIVEPLQWMDPSMLCFEMADIIDEVEPNFESVLLNLRTALPTVDVLVASNPPCQDTGRDPGGVNDWYRSKAEELNFAHVDLFKEGISWDWLNANGMGGDGLHLDSQFYQGAAFKTVAAMGLFTPSIQYTIGHANQVVVDTLVITDDYELTDDEHGGTVICNSESDIILTVPSGLRPGFNCDIVQKGNGQVLLVGATGVTINNILGHSGTSGQWAEIALKYSGYESYYITGDTGVSNAYFTMVIKTDNPGTSADDSFLLPTTLSKIYNYIINWGDGTTEAISTNAPQTHQYPAAGVYTITISGDFPQVVFNDIDDKLKLLDVPAWGNIAFQELRGSFWGCSNCAFTATDAPDLTACTSLKSCFRNCAPVGGMDLREWDTSANESLESAFNGYLGGEVLGIGDFNTAITTNIAACFANSSLDPDVSAWDVGQVTSAAFMFNNSPFSDANYDKLLLGWSAQTVQSGVSFLAGTAQYTEAAARAILTDPPNSWVISDGGPA